jgi:hypothetical protein
VSVTEGIVADRLVPKLCSLSYLLEHKATIFRVQLQFKHQKYTRGWAVRSVTYVLPIASGHPNHSCAHIGSGEFGHNSRAIEGSVLRHRTCHLGSRRNYSLYKRNPITARIACRSTDRRFAPIARP